MNQLKKLGWATSLGLALLLSACSSSVKKVDISSASNPSEEIARVGAEINTGYENQLDVLAAKDFEKSTKHLKEAKEYLAAGKEQRKVLDEVGYAEAYLQRANQTADSRREQVPAIVSARDKALKAGAKNYPPTQKSLKSLDDELRSNADDLKDMKVDDISKMQAAYLDIELASVINQQLGGSLGQINGAKHKKAEKYSPKALKQAELDYAAAENVVRSDRYNPNTYGAAVAKSRLSSEILVATLAATKSGKIDEATAAQLVAKDRQISSLRGDLNAATSESEQLQGALANQNKKLDQADVLIKLQKSLETARKEFSKEEAEVFQQGDKLLIRLKSMNFPSGSSDLPAEALSILAKVKTVAKELDAQQVTVEGHTDSTGNKTVNHELSQARAGSVAKYLETNGIQAEKIHSVGYGFEKPIATNKTKDGRRQNRRVDVIITPEGAATVENSENLVR